MNTPFDFAQHRTPSRRNQRGFTLIEIMVVVVIMGIMAALVVPKLMGRADDAKIEFAIAGKMNKQENEALTRKMSGPPATQP